MSRFESAFVLAVLGAVLPAQGLRITTQIVSEIFVDAEQTPVFPRQRSNFDPQTIQFPAFRALNVSSGYSSASMTLFAVGDGLQSVQALIDFRANLATSNSNMVGTVLSGGEMVLHFDAPTPQAGTLWLLTDTTGSFGAFTTLGDLYFDIGDDGQYDFAAVGLQAQRHQFELPFTACAGGGRIRILHHGWGVGTSASPSAYRASVQAVFMVGTSPVRPHLEGCAPLTFSRWSNGSGTFEFGAAPNPNRLLCITVGTPQAERQERSLPLLCRPHNSLDALQLLTTSSYTFQRQLLQPGHQAVIQGYVFSEGRIRATNSFLVN